MSRIRIPGELRSRISVGGLASVPDPNLFHVADYASLTAALAAVGALASAERVCTLQAGANTYEDAAITVPSYVNLVGVSRDTCLLTHHVIMESHSSLQKFGYTAPAPDDNPDYDDNSGILIATDLSDILIDSCRFIVPWYAIYGLYGSIPQPVVTVAPLDNITITNCELAGVNTLFFASGLLNSTIQYNTGDGVSTDPNWSGCLGWLDASETSFYNNVISDNVMSSGFITQSYPYLMHIAGANNLFERNQITVKSIGTAGWPWKVTGLTPSRSHFIRIDKTSVDTTPNIFRDNTFTMLLDYGEAGPKVYAGSYGIVWHASLIGDIHADLRLENNVFLMSDAKSPAAQCTAIGGPRALILYLADDGLDGLDISGVGALPNITIVPI